MSMVFCRGCGKEIHETALSCPQCGAAQGIPASEGHAEAKNWASLTSFISGILVLLMVMSEPSGKWDSDTVTGGIMFGVVPIIFGTIALTHKQRNSWMAITGILIGVLVVLVSLGSM